MKTTPALSPQLSPAGQLLIIKPPWCDSAKTMPDPDVIERVKRLIPSIELTSSHANSALSMRLMLILLSDLVDMIFQATFHMGLGVKSTAVPKLHIVNQSSCSAQCLIARALCHNLWPFTFRGDGLYFDKTLLQSRFNNKHRTPKRLLLSSFYAD